MYGSEAKEYNTSIGHFRINFILFLKASLGANPFIWKWDFIQIQIILVFMWMVVHQALLW